MEHSIKPEEHELRAAREKVENTVNRFDYALEIEKVSFNLGWQELEKSPSIVSGKNSLNIIIDPEKEDEKFEKKLLRALLEIEFFDKADIDESMFNWQEVLKFAYVKQRVAEITGEEIEPDRALEDMWPDLKKDLGKRTDEFSEEFYMNAAALGGSVGKKLLEDHMIDDIPDLNRSDVIEAGERLFG